MRNYICNVIFNIFLTISFCHLVGAVGVETARKEAKSGGGLPNKIPNMI